MHQRIAPASAPKGKAPLRPCPDDFEIIFVEKGRFDCMRWYRARRETITRWLIERGKDELVAKRAAYVASQRAAGKWITRQTAMVEVRQVKRTAVASPVRDRRKVSITVARHAAQFLRIARNGGWIVSMAPNGDWFVGTKRLSAGQMVELAKGKGFDPKGAKDEPHEVVSTGPRGGTAEQRNKFAEEQRERRRIERGNADLRLGSDWRRDDWQ